MHKGLLCSLLFTRIALAAPPPEAPPPSDAICKKALKQGRALESKKDWKGAIAAFQVCIAADANHPKALSEMGWAAYNDKDLPTAATFTQRAVTAAVNPDQKGASLYNLGLIAEARGDKTAAIAAYTNSIKERQNTTVRARLATLDAKAAAALDPFIPQPMGDPDESIESFCKRENASNKLIAADFDKDYDNDVPKMKCKCSAKPVEKGKVKSAPAPYLAIRVFQSECERGGGMSDMAFQNVYLGVQTAAGWFTQELVSVEQRHYCEENFTLDSLKVGDFVPGGAPEIAVRWSQNGGCRTGESSSSTHLRVAGIGASGKPSITPTIDLAKEESGATDDGEEAKAPSVDTLLEANFDKAGQLVITNGHGAKKDSSLGPHTLVFP